MSVLVVGLSHRSAPVSLLERLALAEDDATKLLRDLQRSEHVRESLVLSTCNRVEVYAQVEKFHGGVTEISELLARVGGVPLETLTAHLYVHYEDRAVQHLFAVACGLDSMAVGEAQILGQIRLAFRTAQEEASAGRVLHELVSQALRVGKRAHTETDIDRAGASLVSIGLELGAAALGALTGRRALVVGAGSMSALAATTLHRAGAGEIVVANRTPARAQRLAGGLGGRGVPLAALAEELAAADVVVSCTGSVGTVLSHGIVEEAVAARAGRPLYLLDLALPRDVDPSVRSLPGVVLTDLESLQAALADREVAADVAAVRRIVTEEVGGFLAWQRSARVAPTVAALRSKAAEVVDAELLRLDSKLPDLDQRARAEVALAVRRVVDKLLHHPTVRVKELAETPGGHSYADVLGELFGLDPTVVDAVTKADVAVEEMEEPG